MACGASVEAHECPGAHKDMMSELRDMGFVEPAVHYSPYTPRGFYVQHYMRARTYFTSVVETPEYAYRFDGKIPLYRMGFFITDQNILNPTALGLEVGSHGLAGLSQCGDRRFFPPWLELIKLDDINAAKCKVSDLTAARCAELFSLLRVPMQHEPLMVAELDPLAFTIS